MISEIKDCLVRNLPYQPIRLEMENLPFLVKKLVFDEER